MKKLDLTKPVQTRSGIPVTLISTKGRELFPFIGYIGESRDISSWDENGRVDPFCVSSTDLMNVPEKKRSGEFQFAVCDDGSVLVVSSQNQFKLGGVAGKNVLAIKSVPWTEGEGL